MLKSILAHKARLLSTTLSIVLGVAFIAGTYILTDTMQDAFQEVFSSTTEGIDIAVRGTAEFQSSFGETDRGLVSPEVLAEVQQLDGIQAASGEVTGLAIILDPDGEPIGGQGPPTLGVNGPIDESLTSATLRDGSFPATDDEVAIDAATAGENGFVVGDTVRIVIDGPAQEFTLSGIVGFGEVDSLAGATLAMFEPTYATELYGQDGFSEVYATAEDGADVDSLITQVSETVGSDYEVLSGDELAQSVTADINAGLGFFTTALLVFAGVSLFVGAFLIANTFTIIVAQRTRELALLRAVGASRRQVVFSVLAEALTVGIVGSLVGLLLGVGVAQLLQAALNGFGIDLPQGDTIIATRTIVVSLVVGVLVTMAAALLPAIRSTRVSPVEAMQAVAAPPPRRQGVLRYVVGGLLFVGGVIVLGIGLFADGGIQVVGAGAALTLFGAASLSSLVTTPIVTALGAPIAATRGIPGQLAKENAIRAPRRTAATASALMIGLALVSFTFVMGASIERSAVVGIDEAFLSDFQVSPIAFGGALGAGFPFSAVGALDELDEVAVATPLQVGEFRFDGTSGFLAGVEAERIDQALTLQFLEGDWAAVEAGGLLVSENVATNNQMEVGDEVELTFAATGAISIPVGAIFDGANVDASWLVDEAVFDANFREPSIQSAYVTLHDGVSVSDARPAVEAALEPYPTVQLQDLDEVKQSISDQINQLLGLLNALLALSVIIALFGIVNTLGLSVLERTRELGLLRAVGGSRSQVRTMIRWESVLIAVLGAALGLVIGVLFGWMVVTSLADLGISQFVVPGGRLAVSVLIAALAGVLAAIIPARRASRIDILRSLEAQ
ncbi:MAG TPA: ABC transporter permease [Euzebya sp.]|nr:ABC transporter permease [Euzebya sp.]